jgi:hypothetical protein
MGSMLTVPEPPRVAPIKVLEYAQRIAYSRNNATHPYHVSDTNSLWTITKRGNWSSAITGGSTVTAIAGNICEFGTSKATYKVMLVGNRQGEAGRETTAQYYEAKQGPWGPGSATHVIT